MKVHIMGASGAGSTTLGEALAAKLQYRYFDTDQYFWLPSKPPFTIRRNPHERNVMLKADLAEVEKFIIGGSLVNWGDEWLSVFDLVVFLYLPPQIRMQRLKDRELERYGDVIFTNPERLANYQKYLAWAEAYDTNSISGRTLNAHQTWLRKVTCPVLEITGDITVEQRLNLVLSKIKA